MKSVFMYWVPEYLIDVQLSVNHNISELAWSRRKRILILFLNAFGNNKEVGDHPCSQPPKPNPSFSTFISTQNKTCNIWNTLIDSHTPVQLCLLRIYIGRKSISFISISSESKPENANSCVMPLGNFNCG